MRSDWPLVGRREELQLILDARAAGAGGVVLSGAAGVGKSRLATEATAQAAAEGWAVLEVRTTPGMAALPLAPFARLVGAGTDTSDRLAAAHEGVARHAAGRPLVLFVDDAHLLDDVSAGLLHQLASTGAAFVLATARGGEARPAALTGLWKDGLAERVELQPLSRSQTQELAEGILDGSIDDVSLRRLWSDTEGNALFVRELVLAGVESGKLTLTNGAWRWRGAAATTGRLREVIGDRLTRLDGKDREAFEMVALGGTVRADMLTQLAGHEALDNLERAQLINVERRGIRSRVSVTHPTYAEAVRESMPSERAEAIYAQLVEVAEAGSATTPTDVLSVALWRLAQGAAVDSATLLAASDAARWSVAEIVVEQLNEVLGAERNVESIAGPVAWRPGTGDPELALRAARAAFTADRGASSGAALAIMLVALGQAREADAVLHEIEELHLAPTERASVVIARMSLLQWSLDRIEQARELELDAETWARAAPDGEHAVRDLLCARSALELNVGDMAACIEAAQEVLDDREQIDAITLLCAATAAAALGIVGRTTDAIDLVDEYLPMAMAMAGVSALMLGQLIFARFGALLCAGRFAEAETLGHAAYDIAIASDVAEGAGAFGLGLGRLALMQGRPATALRHLREAEATLAERDPFNYRPWALAGLALAYSDLGERDAAEQAARAANSLRTSSRFYDPDVSLAMYRALNAMGAPAAATDVIELSIRRSADSGLYVDEAVAHHAAAMETTDARERGLHHARLAELRDQTDGLLVGAYARHVEGLVSGSGAVLDDAAEQLAVIGANLVAASAATAAAAAYDGAGNKRAAQASGRRATALLECCEGAIVGAATLARPPANLTDRELEIARMAAAGRSSKEIAEHLVVSVRTVDSHLYRVYTKLGVTGRAALATALHTSQ